MIIVLIAPWAPRVSSGLQEAWLLMAPPGISWPSCMLFLAPPNASHFAWLLLVPSWLLLATPGSCMLLLATPGSS